MRRYLSRRYLSAAAVVGLWSLLGLQNASAQIGSYSPPQTNPHPTISPYLNMNRGNAAINYFGVVRPQMDMARGLQSLQQNFQYSQGNGAMNPLGVTDQQDPNNYIITGHPVSFMNSSHYFPVGGARMTGMGTGIGSSSTRTINNSPTPLGYPRR